MDGPVRRVVKYNFDHYRKKGVGWSTIVCGKGVRLESDCIREKDPPISKYQKGETRHGFLCLIFLQKENPIVQFAMRISGSF